MACGRVRYTLGHFFPVAFIRQLRLDLPGFLISEVLLPRLLMLNLSCCVFADLHRFQIVLLQIDRSGTWSKCDALIRKFVRSLLMHRKQILFEHVSVFSFCW